MKPWGRTGDTALRPSATAVASMTDVLLYCARTRARSRCRILPSPVATTAPSPQTHCSGLVLQSATRRITGIGEEVPCFLVAKPGSTALRLVVDYGEVNKKTQNHSGIIPNMEKTLERIAKCRYKTKMDKHSGFWQVDLTAAAQELLAFVTPKGRVFKWKVMPFRVANALALPGANEQNFVHTEAQISSTGVDFSGCRNGGPHRRREFGY